MATLVICSLDSSKLNNVSQELSQGEDVQKTSGKSCVELNYILSIQINATLRVEPPRSLIKHSHETVYLSCAVVQRSSEEWNHTEHM